MFVFKAYSQTKLLTHSIKKLSFITFFKESVNLLSLVFKSISLTSENEIKKKVVSGRIRNHNLRIWSYVVLPHDYSEKYNFLELMTDIIAIAPIRLFP